MINDSNTQPRSDQPLAASFEHGHQEYGDGSIEQR